MPRLATKTLELTARAFIIAQSTAVESLQEVAKLIYGDAQSDLVIALYF